MNSEKIIMELSRISTPTGITCCGDITLDDSTCDEIIEYVTYIEEKANKYDTLQQQKDQLIKYLEDFVNKTDYEVNVKENYPYLAWANAYKDLLERIKSGKYE